MGNDTQKKMKQMVIVVGVLLGAIVFVPRIVNLFKPNTYLKIVASYSGFFPEHLLLTWSPDNILAVVGNGGDSIYLFEEARLWLNPKTLDVDPLVWRLFYNDDGTQLAARTSDGINIWSMPEGELIERSADKTDTFSFNPMTLEYDSETQQVTKINQDGEIVFSFSVDEELGDIDVTDDDKLVVGVVCEKDGILECEGRNILMFDTKTGEQVASLESELIKSYVYFSPNGQYVAGSGTGKKEIWDLSTEKIHFEVPNRSSFTPDNQHIIVRDVNSGIRIWHVESGREANVIYDGEGESGRVTQFAISRDGKYLATVKEYAGEVRIWEFGR